jgi:hypothetical protein
MLETDYVAGKDTATRMTSRSIFKLLETTNCCYNHEPNSLHHKPKS